MLWKPKLITGRILKRGKAPTFKILLSENLDIGMVLMKK